MTERPPPTLGYLLALLLLLVAYLVGSSWYDARAQSVCEKLCSHDGRVGWYCGACYCVDADGHMFRPRPTVPEVILNGPGTDHMSQKPAHPTGGRHD